MLFAKSTILIHLKSVRVVLFVFDSIIVALFALCTCQCDFNSHFGTSSLFLEIQASLSRTFFGATKKSPLSEVHPFYHKTAIQVKHFLRKTEVFYRFIKKCHKKSRHSGKIDRISANFTWIYLFLSLRSFASSSINVFMSLNSLYTDAYLTYATSSISLSCSITSSPMRVEVTSLSREF